MKPTLRKSPLHSIKFSKKLLLACLIISWLAMPELLWHKLTIAVHILYESISFVLEEILIHGFGLSKTYAQMAIFYSSWAIALLLLYKIWRSLPQLSRKLKTALASYALQIKYKALATWLSLNTVQKIKLMLFQFVGITGGFILLLA